MTMMCVYALELQVIAGEKESLCMSMKIMTKRKCYHVLAVNNSVFVWYNI